MSVDTVIRGGTVVTATGTAEASVAIDDGEIVAVGREDALPTGERTVDATGSLVMPGLVDPHVHIDDVPDNRAGDYRTETSAAALGGVTTVIDFAFQGGDRTLADPDAGLLDGIEHKREMGSESIVDFSVHGTLHRETPATFDELDAAIEAGVTSFKLFMSTYDIGVSTGFVAEAFDEIAARDGVAAVHAENPSVCEMRTRQLREADASDPGAYADARPDYAEAMATDDALRMAAASDVKYYGVHVSCRDAVEAIARARDDGSRIRAETCAHYLALDRSAHAEQGPLSKMAPPLRTPDDVDALFDALADGTLDIVSTDHSVYHREAKEVDRWWDAPFGVHSLQWSLPVVHTEAVVERNFSLPWLVQAMSTAPARTFGLPEKGTLEPGTDADVIVFDPNATVTIRAEDDAANTSYSIYEGREVRGRIDATFVRGEQVVEDGALVGDPGTGRFVERTLPDWAGQ